MSFNDRNEFINAQSSEKITLAHVEARARLFEWTLHSGNTWKKVVPNFVVGLKQDQSNLTMVNDLGSVGEGAFYYDTVTGTLYAYFNSAADPITIQAIVTYKFFYADGTATLSWDLTNTGKHVPYEGRIKSSPGYKHKIGIDQSLTSVVGNGTLKLENSDGGLDDKFDTLIYENRDVTIYSWNRDLDFDQAKIIYRGKITNKSYDTKSASFSIKDSLFNLEQAIPLEPYTDTDNVNDDIKGRYKRQIFGRVDGLKLQSIDQIGEGYALTGTVQADAGSQTVTGTGTQFLAETSPDDKITLGSQEFTIDDVVSDTELTVDASTTFGFTGITATVLPDIPTTNKNRVYFVAGHACSNLTYSIVSILQLNRIVLSSTVGLIVGDLIEFANGERKEIKTVAPGNIVVLTSNIIVEPVISSNIIRQPIQKLYKERSLINADNFTVNNVGSPTNQCTVTLDSTVEFDLTRAITLGFDLAFTNASRVITTPDDVDLRETLSPRDWIRPSNIAYTTYYEVLSVTETQVQLRVAFADPTISGSVTAKLPDYIADDTIMSAEVIGKTVDGEPFGEWIEKAPQAVRDILTQIAIPTTLINDTSFVDALVDTDQVLSLSLPLSPSGGSVKAKTAIDLINKSVFGSLTLDNDLKLKYKILQTDTPENPIIVRDQDLIDWSIKTTNGKNFRDALVRYRHKDVDRVSLEVGNQVKKFTNEFVRDYIETSKLEEFDAYIFNDTDAQIYAERQTYYNQLGRTDIKLVSDLRFENVEIGDVMQLEMKRLYKRKGSDSSRKKLAIVIGKSVTGKQVNIELTDLGNLFNSSAMIAPDTTNDFSSATEDEKLKYGYITDTEGIVDGDESTANTNLIS